MGGFGFDGHGGGKAGGWAGSGGNGGPARVRKRCPEGGATQIPFEPPPPPCRSVELIPTVARTADVTMQQAGVSSVYCGVRPQPAMLLCCMLRWFVACPAAAAGRLHRQLQRRPWVWTWLLR